jgi:hypothetical protein
LSFSTSGTWGWGVNSAQREHQAMWENPGNGYAIDCSTWGTLENCVAISGDFMFDLQGTSTRG